MSGFFDQEREQPKDATAPDNSLMGGKADLSKAPPKENEGSSTRDQAADTERPAENQPTDQPLVSSSAPAPIQPEKLNDDHIIDTPEKRAAAGTQAPTTPQENAEQTSIPTVEHRPAEGGASVVDGYHITCPVCAHQFDSNAVRL